MANSAINYLFPPDQISNLPTWRFILHFKIPDNYGPEQLQVAIHKLQAAEWKVVTFPFGLEHLALGKSGEYVEIPIEVPEQRRHAPNGLADYESDVWKIMGNMLGAGFGELFYEAIDWQDPDG